MNHLRLALFYLGDQEGAQYVFDEGFSSDVTIRCDSCSRNNLETAYTCTSCFDTDFCDRCVGDDSDKSGLESCKKHNLVEFKRSLSANVEESLSRPTMEEWLNRLVATYSVEESEREDM
jgi:hypothetical protein